MPPRYAPIATLLLLLSCLGVTACSWPRSVSTADMIAQMNQRKSMASSHYNKLWYQGSAGDYHYFKHIRGYFLDEANFKVPDAQLHIPQPTPYSSDSERWSEVVRLGKDWHAATKDGAADGWRRLTCEAPSHWRCLELEL